MLITLIGGACTEPADPIFTARQTRTVDERGRTPLHSAARDGNLPTVRGLLAAGADIRAGDHQEWTALHWAAIGGQARAIELLLAAGAPVDPLGRFDMTPLHWASLTNRRSAVEALVRAGADLEARNIYGMTPLHDSADPEVVRILVRAGANLDAVDDWGLTPLHRARAESAAKALIEAGADMMATSRDGRAPVHMLNVMSEKPPWVVALPRTGSLRLRGDTTQLPIRVRNLEPRPLTHLRMTAVTTACRVTVVPQAMQRVQPAQMTTFTLTAQRLPDVPAREDSVEVTLLSGPTELLKFNLRVNTIPEETPEDRGMIRVGKLNIRAAPSRWQWLAYGAAPLLLLAIWFIQRRRTRRHDGDDGGSAASPERRSN